MPELVFKVFLSTPADMEEYRQAAIGVCNDLSVQYVGRESLRLGDDLSAAIQGADVVVIVVGARPNDLVQREYEEAIKLKKPILVFSAKSAPETFEWKVWADRTASYFQTPQEFASLLRNTFVEIEPLRWIQRSVLPPASSPTGEEQQPTAPGEATQLFRKKRPSEPSEPEKPSTDPRESTGSHREYKPTPGPPQSAAPSAPTAKPSDEPVMPTSRDLRPSSDLASRLRRLLLGRPIKRTSEYTVVKVFYATDRKTSSAESPKRFYANERAPNRTLALGVCEVSIPGLDYHKVGRLEAPSIFSLQFRDNPGKHILLLAVQPQDSQVFFQNVTRYVANSERREAFVFIHGYNVSFEDAARRTAQLASDLQFQGAPIFYSWPSKARWWRYTADETNVAWCVPQLEGFLGELAHRSGANTIHLIAHSMGNRALTAALQLIVAKRSIPKRLFHQIILTAPDIDEETFQSLAVAIASDAEHLTMYSNYKDRALLLSKMFHFYRRAGASIVIVPGMETIDASKVDTSLVRHSYFGNSRTVLADVASLMVDGKPAKNRFGMIEKQKEGKTYYFFRP
jgi:esterase/lipase superfamily enzyme